MNEPAWLDYVTAIGAIATPLLVIGLSGVGWLLRPRMERRKSLEDKLREDRVETYNLILEPFVILLMSDAAWQSDHDNDGASKETVATQKMLSMTYRLNASKMSLVGADAVVRSYNDLMQFFFHREVGSDGVEPANSGMMVGLLGRFLLEIRRSMGNEATTLDQCDMLEWFITDAREYRKAECLA
jgi:hypothetical protein